MQQKWKSAAQCDVSSAYHFSCGSARISEATLLLSLQQSPPQGGTLVERTSVQAERTFAFGLGTRFQDVQPATYARHLSLCPLHVTCVTQVMVLLTQLDVAACREAFAAHDCDVARLRAMLSAVHTEADDEAVLELCSQVAVARPLHVALGEHSASEHGGGGSPGGPDGGSAAGSHGMPSAAAGAGLGGCASFEVLLREVEQYIAGAEDAEEETRQAFSALGGNADGTGELSTKRLRAVCKARAGARGGRLCSRLGVDVDRSAPAAPPHLAGVWSPWTQGRRRGGGNHGLRGVQAPPELNAAEEETAFWTPAAP